MDLFIILKEIAKFFVFTFATFIGLGLTAYLGFFISKIIEKSVD